MEDQTQSSAEASRLNKIKEGASQVSARAAESYQNIKSKANVYGQGAQEFIDSVGTYIKENPQRSAIIAGAFGLGLGLMLGRMMRRD